jgi:putative DNA primase/helicase
MTVAQFQCPYCSEAFTTRLEVISHSVNFHPGRPIGADLDAKYGPDEDISRAQQIEWNKKVAEAAEENRKLEHTKFGRDTKRQSPQDQAFELAELLKGRFNFKTMNDTREIYYYKDGRYLLNGERVIEVECAKIVADVKTSVVNEVREIIRRTTPIDRVEFDKDINVLNVKNGLLNLKTGDFRCHTSKHLSLIQVPVEYNKKSTCKKIIHFLYNIMADPNNVPLVLEFMAYCLLRDAGLQKHLLIVGEEDNGKSVLLALIRAFLGIENTSSITLHQLTCNRFATSALFGKFANIFADISAKRLDDIETFKNLGGIDRISAEKKNKDAFEFDPTTKLIFSANVPPKPTEEMDDPYYRRWLLVQTSLRKLDYFCGCEIKRDKALVKKLTTDEQLSGLLNLIIVSAKRLTCNWSFCKNPSTSEIRELYERLADPVKAWIDERCELGKQFEGDKERLHSDYIDYCWKKQYRRLGITTLGRELVKYGVHDAQRGIGKNRRHIWQGITLKEKDLEHVTL